MPKGNPKIAITLAKRDWYGILRALSVFSGRSEWAEVKVKGSPAEAAMTTAEILEVHERLLGELAKKPQMRKGG